ncbi:hypothetical protein [Hymenobacter sp. YC55]|uniref:toxin-antitoxin system YwqK family antitoxin n=1 Tax=Hymenobacter sp. YC55 TaxID=3034019 RepID=UPI0023F77BCE|nr:hypothetical protein [Hymenobacter sp. YC55]MDF7812540.1 hypothetical protein [Hymenobacter sp. YC55]
MLRIYKRSCLALCSILWLGTVTTWAQKPLQKEEKAKLDDCYRVVGKDSVVFFYSADYVLTPPGCAAIRRHIRLDSAGHFWGYVRDYKLSNNKPLLQGAYREGLMEGPFEVYHDTGELAARGNYRKGQQVGDWAYWYPSGRKRQVLSFRNGLDPLVQQFWDEAGQQLVKDGNGTWYRQEDGMQLSGAVVGGIPDGRWQLRRINDEHLVARENFVKGNFRNGVLIDQMYAYRDQSRFSVADWEQYRAAEKYSIGTPCSSGK